MALINCPECGNQMSDTAKKCTHCGYKTKKLNKKVIWGIILIILGIGALVLCEFQLDISKKFYSDMDHYIAAVVLCIVMIGCIVGSIILLSKYKSLKNTIIGLLLMSILVLIYQFIIEYNEKQHDENNIEVTINDNSVQQKGWKYIQENLNNADINCNRFQYLNEEVFAEEDSPFKQFEGLSCGFYDYRGESLGNGQIWVFFKHGEPRFMTIRKNWKSELSDSEIILLLIDAWEDKSQSDRDLDRIKNNAYREMQFDPSYQRMMRNARGY